MYFYRRKYQHSDVSLFHLEKRTHTISESTLETNKNPTLTNNFPQASVGLNIFIKVRGTTY